MKKQMCIIAGIIFFVTPLFAQQKNHTQLKNNLQTIISKHKGSVGLAVVEIETGDTFSLNNSIHFAMQSVFKFPLALTVLHLAEIGKLDLNKKVLIQPALWQQFNFSALKTRYPGDSLRISIDSLIMYSISYSDNLATDKLFEIIGGTKVANNFMRQLGFKNIQIKYNEIEIGGRMKLMYENNSTPYEISLLLQKFYQGKIVNEPSKNKLLHYMIINFTTEGRLKGSLEPNVVVAHKTGTSPFDDSLNAICNDVGIIYMPNGNHLAISIFVMNTKENYAITEKLIATLTKEIFNFYNN